MFICIIEIYLRSNQLRYENLPQAIEDRTSLAVIL